MIPRKTEWRRWGTRAKVDYLAQLATLLTLVATVFFSAMAWREARQAYAFQREVFVAQNAPRLVVSSVNIEDDWDQDQQYLNIIVKNVGESYSKSFCMRGSYNNLTPMFSACNDIFSDISLPKDGTFRYVLPIRKKQRDVLGFKPAFAKVIGDDPVGRECASRPSNVLVVELAHSDVLGSKLGSLSQIHICGNRTKPSLNSSKNATLNR